MIIGGSMFKKLIAVFIVAFVVGWFSSAFAAGLAPARAEPLIPESVALQPSAPEPLPAFEPARSAPGPQVELVDSRERSSPADRLTVDRIHVTSNRVVIDGIPGRRFETAIFTDTNSMDPLLDEDSQAIQVVPLSPDEITVGDVISYDPGLGIGIIIHRVIQIGNDKQGWYAIVKGDNNPSPDPVKVRFNMLKRVLVGVLY